MKKTKISKSKNVIASSSLKVGEGNINVDSNNSDIAINNSVIQIIFSRIEEITNRYKKKPTIEREVLEKSLQNHLIEVRNWCKEINLRGLNRPKNVNDIYVDLEYFLTPLREQYVNEKSEKVEIVDLVKKTKKNILILGQPGAGKTTSLKNIAFQILNNQDFDFIIVIRFRELGQYGSTTFKKNEGLYAKIYSILGFSDKDEYNEDNIFLLKSIVLSALDELNAVILLDGFDEIPFDDKMPIVHEIKDLAFRLSSAKFVLTSRTSEFPFIIDNTERYEIAPLTENQITFFAEKWLQNSEKSKNFLLQLVNYPYKDTSIRPLTLAHLLTIFEKTTPHRIPEEPKEVYEMVVNLLLRDWDEQRGFDRKTKFSQFRVERKKQFLQKLSFYLTKKFLGTSFDFHSIKIAYLDIHANFKLEKEEAEDVIKELESHSGLFVKISVNKYEFAHKSIQEYFTAEYLKGLPITEIAKYIEPSRIPDELAILISLSSEPNIYFSHIIGAIIKENYDMNFIDTFLNRVFLENPDFTPTEELGYWTLLLYDYINKSSFHEENGAFFRNGIRMFDRLVSENNAIFKSISLLQNYYQINSNYAHKIIRTLKGEKGATNFEDLVQVHFNENLYIVNNPFFKDKPALYCKLKHIHDWISVHMLDKKQIK